MYPRILILSVAFATFAAIAAVASRANIIYEANFGGTSAPAETTFTFSGGAPKVTRDSTGYTYLGIKGGGTPEIDKNQSLTVTFDQPVVLGGIQLYRLFDGETAILSVGTDTYRLSAFGDAAHYSRNGVWLYDMPADMDGPLGAQYAITSMFSLDNPFDGAFVSTFTLSAPRGSSFGLMSFYTVDGTPAPTLSNAGPSSNVPETPMSFVLMLLGGAALVTYAKLAPRLTSSLS